MTRDHSIRRRLLGDQILLILLLGGVLMGTTFLGARRAVESLSSTLINRAADQAESELRRFFEPVSTVLELLTVWDSEGLIPDGNAEAARRLLDPAVERLPQASGILLARDDGSQRFLVRTDGGWNWRESAVDSSEEDYDPRTRPWFSGALAAGPGTIAWTEPYPFLTQETAGITASILYGESGERVAGIDVNLDDLVEYVRGFEVSQGGSLWILTGERRLLAWPEEVEFETGRARDAILLEKPEELGLPLVADSAAAIRNRSDDPGTPVRFSSGGQGWWVAGRRFALSSERELLIAVLVPHSDLLGERANLRWWILAATLAALGAAVVRAGVLARRFSDPIEALARQSDRIRLGDLEPGEPITTKLTEVRQLAESQEKMRRGLKTLMKLEGDLQVARQIQQSTWPRELPTLQGFEIAAWSQPADETGGDSYDVIGLTEAGSLTDGEASSLILMLADATGHGIGPALSVTQLRAMLRMAVRNGSLLADTAANLNEQLYDDLPKNRFITAWLGHLEADGKLATFSGGQAPLFLHRAASGEVEVLPASAPPLGLLPPMPLVLPPPIQLEPGDVYVVLSDGFYEAESPEGEEFEKEGVIAVLERHSGAAPDEILEALRNAVIELTEDAPLADDRTAVIVKREA